MSDTVIAALIAAVVAVLGNMIGAALKSKELDKDEALFRQEVRNELADVKAELKTVNRRLDEHNGYAELFSKTSTTIALIQKDIDYIKQGHS